MLASTIALASAAASSGTSPTTVISILSGLIAALIAIAGGVGTWAALRVAKNSQLIANYEATATSWERRATSLKAEKEGVEDQLKDALAAVSSLHAKISALQDIATGQPAVEKLTMDMNSIFQLIATQLNRIESHLTGAGNGGGPGVN